MEHMEHYQEPKKYTIKDFLPLIIIFVCIVAATTIKAAVLQQWELHSLMYDFMGSFFVVFGFFKIINLNAFVEAYSTYDLITQQSRIYGYVYPFIELTLGICYFMRWFLATINFITLVIMLVSAAGVFNELRKGKTIVCACLGTVFKIPMTYVTLVEDLLMAIMALMMLFL